MRYQPSSRPDASGQPGAGVRPRAVRHSSPRGRRGLQRERQRHLPDAPGGVTRLERLLPVLAALSGTTLRLWRAKTPGGRLVPVVGGLGEGREAPRWTPTPNGGGRLDTPDGPAWFQPIPSVNDTWLEVKGEGEQAAVELAEVISAVMEAEEETGQVAAELSGRYEEIDLIYTISEILGHTIRLDEAANRILREVSAVVRARRATLLDRKSTRLNSSHTVISYA